MTTELTNAERETHISMCADDRSTWEISSDDPVMQRRFESVGASLIRQRGETKFYTLPVNQISLRNPPKPMSDERKAELGTRLRALRDATQIVDAKQANRARYEDGEGE